jgi:hypothetical protein
MSSLSHSVGGTIVRFITVVMKQLGGIGQASTRLSVHGHCGAKHIRCRQARPKLTTVVRELCGIKITKRSQIRSQHPMTSLKQIEANRRNAMKSTGPKTEAGKEHSRRNAVRHGLTAETVVNVLEDPEDYKAFEIAVASDFDVQTAVERELVLRLASLLWRLRRATAIDTGFLQIPSDIDKAPDLEITEQANETTGVVQIEQFAQPHEHEEDESAGKPDLALNSEISRRFLRLDPGSLERLGRYETALWRQAYQVIFVLDYLRRKNLDLKWLPRPSSSAGRFRPLRSLFPKGSGRNLNRCV